ncbi:unnamed protein product [Rotaria socialis]|uniref:BZIP domain-containing protein n=1 Tax=Rotaria socialis TaxID=392032 RepID=A0A820NIR2_9BILA|nr:unnamed protein product [Rotaria socialis]CAF4484932.1 unnamed protein product [Rotaria socialis]CAF4493512.1 unnamed protein product [Rotaria socialis]CAF4538456.1 unnamed protein product [Rotaria socialis]CAF4822559.1 unnamed protein product [Rotaria socialis]
MQRRSVPRTDPRYNQIRAKNNDSVKKSREKSRRERDETIESINQLEHDNKELVERIKKMKQEYEQLQELFKKHTGIEIDQILSSQTNSPSTSSIQPKPVEESKRNSSTPVLTINTSEDKTTTALPELPIDPNNLDGAIVLINGCHQETLSIDNTNINKRKKQDFYCAACKSMCETIFRDMNNVDSNERVQVGSYRVDGHGHQKLKDVPIIETSYHAENVVEDLCSKFINDAREVIPSPLKNLYEHACDDILEEHHDSLIDLLVTQNKSTSTSRQLAELFCVEMNQYCKINQLEELFKSSTIPTPTPSPLVEDKQEEANEQNKNEL